LYEVWKGMKARCRDPKHIGYKIYGGKGVRVCKEWQESFIPFYEWCMANGWQKGMQIDKDIKAKELGVPALIYSPEMCSIVTAKDNARASSQTKLRIDKIIEIRNSKSTGIELGKKYGVHESTINKIRNNQVWK
jgi:hypothetical protein